MKFIYEDRIVVFLDILGFQKIINKTLQPDGSDNSSEIENLVNTFKDIECFTMPDHTELNNGKKVTQFSDSLVISFPVTLQGGLWSTLFDLRLLIINLINRNMLCRGAITIGKLYHDKYVFGPALIEAYILESNIAYYPRVILSEKVIKAGKKSPYFIHTSEEEEHYIKDLLDKDEDAMYFIDYFNIGESALDDPENFPIYLGKLRENNY